MAYEFKNGILHKDGMAIMGFGVSYYPSFYPTKYPVPPTADRMSEMKKDLRLMHESGFHFLRAAALCGKHAWTAELDARTKMPSRKFYQATYSIIGAGHKGICYYQWRGDYPHDGAPEGDVCGLLHYDGTKTDAFDRDVKLLKYLNGFSDKIVKCSKKRTHIAVLHSDYGYAYADALTDNLMGGVNIWQYITVSICKKLYQLGFNVDFVRASDLDKNIFDVKALCVPVKYMLSDEETEKIDAFAKAVQRYFSTISPAHLRLCAPTGSGIGQIRRKTVRLTISWAVWKLMIPLK